MYDLSKFFKVQAFSPSCAYVGVGDDVVGGAFDAYGGGGGGVTIVKSACACVCALSPRSLHTWQVRRLKSLARSRSQSHQLARAPCERATSRDQQSRPRGRCGHQLQQLASPSRYERPPLHRQDLELLYAGQYCCRPRVAR